MDDMVRRLLFVVCGAALVGCGDGHETHMQSVTGGGPAPADETARCPPGTEAFRYGPDGLVRTDPATGVTVRLLKASDAPPTRGFNDWTIGVTDQSGAPMPNAELRWACAWMPAHNHGSNPKSVMRLGNGQFVLSRQNLAMYGGWQVKLWIDATGTGPVFDPQSGNGIVGGDACRGTGVGAAPNIQFDICVPTTPDS